MSLVTRCPACSTSFRVQPTQLSARAGKVRCGNCGMVFDGISGLQHGEAAGAAATGLDLDVGDPISGPTDLAVQPEPPAAARPAPKAAKPPAAKPPAASARKPSSPLPRMPPLRGNRTQAASSFGLLWGFFAFLMLIVFAAQLLFYFRDDVAVRLPQARVYFTALCEEFGCTLRLPHRPELMSIESSDLQADSRREGLIQFNAVLRNRAETAQEYPSLEVTLTDERDRAVARRVLEPAEYLESAQATQSTEQGIAAGAEAAIRLHFDTGRLRATGYRLYLFYH